MVDRCVICGEPVPEGRQVCSACIERTVGREQDDMDIHTATEEAYKKGYEDGKRDGVKWLPVVGYEGLYEVNEYGLIRNSDGKIMRQRLKKAKYTDYKKVSLWKDGKYQHLYVSRIVAEAFIPNNNGLPLVNHKDEDGTNNWVGNLEWCDRSYNAKYGSSPKKISKANTGRISEKRKAVEQMLYGKHIAYFNSTGEAAEAVGCKRQNISKVCNGSRRHAGGFEWRWADCPNCGARMDGE